MRSKQLRNILKYIFGLLVLFQIVHSNNISVIFSPFYINKIDFEDNTSTPLHIQIAKESPIVFASLGQDGIAIFDESGSIILQKQNLNNTYINSFDVSKDGSYLIGGVKEKVIIYQYMNKTQNSRSNNEFVQIGSAPFPSEIICICYIQGNNIIIAAGTNGQVVAYDASQLDHIYSIAQFNTTSALINNIQLSTDYQWIYLSCDYLGTLILQFIDDGTNPNTLKRQGQLLLVAHGKGTVTTQCSIATKDNAYVYEIDTWYGFYYANCSDILTRTKEQPPLQLQFNSYWPFKNTSPNCFIMMLSNDDLFIFLGARSQGIFILDNSDRENIKFFQLIQIDTLVYSISISRTQEYIYFSNGQSIFIFNQVQPNLNNDYPNLFNVQQAKEDLMDGNYKWRCIIDQKEEYLIGIFDYSGLFIYPFFGDPYNLQLTNMKFIDEYPDSADLDPTGKYMLFPRGIDEKLIIIYQIAPLDDSPQEQTISFMNPKEVSAFYVNTIQICETLVFSFDRNYAIATYATGILLLDVQNIFEIKLIYHWMNLPNMLGENQGAAMTRDNKWILSTIRLYGIYVLNVENKSNLMLTDLQITFGGESILMSQISDLYAYLMDGINGFAIIDLTKLPKISFLSRVQLPGWSVTCMFLKNETYALVSSMENGMLSLIDMIDKSNPQLISSFQYGNQFANAVCGPKSGDYIFITTPQSIITLPLVSSVSIHTDVSEIFIDEITLQQTIVKQDKQLNIQTFNQNSQEFTFLVGSTIQFNFAIIYPPHEDTSIIGVQEYNDGLYLDLPIFMSFNQKEQTLILTASKEQMDSSNRLKPNLNTFLIKTIIPLVQQQFVFDPVDRNDKAVTDLTQSQLIINYLQDKGFIDSRQVVSQTFDSSQRFSIDQQFLQSIIDPNSTLEQDEFDQISTQLTQKIKLVLMKSVVINPVKYYVLNSLSINVQSRTQFISSPYSSYIYLQLTVDKEIGKFVDMNYIGVISSTSEQQEIIKIEGTLDNLNRILGEGILFALDLNQQMNSSLQINIQIIDDVNFPISVNIPIEEFECLQLKDRIQVNSQQTLQQQIDKQFGGSVIDIEADITFTFAQNSFITNQPLITYDIQYKIGGNPDDDKGYQEVTPDLWIQFQSDQRLSFRGTTISDYFRNEYHFRVTASDSYSDASDQFTLKVYGIPFLYVFNLLLKIVGPLVAFLSLYSKRFVFYNIIFKNSVTFYEEIAICDLYYQKQIVLLGKTLQDSKLITHILFNKINSMHKMKKENNHRVHEFGDNTARNQDERGEFKYREGVLRLPLQNDIEQDIFSNLQESTVHIHECEVAQKMFQKRLYIGNSVGSITNNKKTIEQLSILKYHIPSALIEKRYLKENGSLSMSAIVRDIFHLNLLNTLSNSTNLSRIQDYSVDLKNYNSRIYRAVRASAVRQLLNLDKRTQIVYDYIKYYCYQHIHKSMNDWYKGIVTIEYRNSSKQTMIFPSIEIKCDVLFQILNSIKLFNSDQNNISPTTYESIIQLSKINQIHINFSLIKEALIADALGFSSYIPSAFQPSLGESIHLYAQDIKSIIAYKTVHSSHCMKPILKYFNLDHTKYGVSKNMMLPSWICLDQKHGMITFQGIPQNDDIDEIQIRIYDITGYIIKQFILKIVIEQNNIDHHDNNYSIPDEQNYIQSKVKASNEACQISFQNSQNNNFIDKLSFSMQRSPKYSMYNRNQSRQINFDSQNYPQAPKIPIKKCLQMQEYEFSKNSNSKNTFSKSMTLPEENLTPKILYQDDILESTQNY